MTLELEEQIKHNYDKLIFDAKAYRRDHGLPEASLVTDYITIADRNFLFLKIAELQATIQVVGRNLAIQREVTNDH